MTSLQKPVSRAAEKRERINAKQLAERHIYRAVSARDLHACRACGRNVSSRAIGMLLRAHHHHIVFRSAGGDTSMSNVCLLCAICHADVHAHRLTVEGDANKRLKIRRIP
jgi:5-methylcytosine-specific restriction endonuclease McrA